MKKVLSFSFALFFACLSLIPAFAQNEQPGISVINDSRITAELMEEYKDADELYFTSVIESIEKAAFKEISAKYIVFKAEFPEEIKHSGLSKDAVVIFPDFMDKKDNKNCKSYISWVTFNDSAENNTNWFTYGLFDIFGKKVLVFTYNPVIDEKHCDWYDELIKDISPDYVYFESLNNSENGFYISGKAYGNEIADGKDVNANPGFICKIIINLYLSNISEKITYGTQPGGGGGSFIINWIVNLFKSH